MDFHKKLINSLECLFWVDVLSPTTTKLKIMLYPPFLAASACLYHSYFILLFQFLCVFEARFTWLCPNNIDWVNNPTTSAIKSPMKEDLSFIFLGVCRERSAPSGDHLAVQNSTPAYTGETTEVVEEFWTNGAPLERLNCRDAAPWAEGALEEFIAGTCNVIRDQDRNKMLASRKCRAPRLSPRPGTKLALMHQVICQSK